MKALAIHTCPVWEDQDGQRLIGFHPAQQPDPEVVGWVNVMVLELYGQQHELLLSGAAS